MKFRLLLLVCLLALAACSPYKKLSYVRNSEQADSLWAKNKPGYRLQSNDELFIRIISSNEEINALYNPIMGEAGTASTATKGGMYLFGYNISDSGTVIVPPLGIFKVAGLTIFEVEQLLQKETDKVLTNAFVIVKLAEFKITVLGEVKKPGNIVIQNNKFTIFEGIAEAGDILYTGKRTDVLIIRQEETGTRSFRVDLTDPNLLASSNYYLTPNDIIIVNPTFMHATRANLQDFFLVVGSVSSVIASIFLLSRIN